MSEILIALSAAAFFVFGCFVIRRIDILLNQNDTESVELRIGVEYPGMEAVIAEELGILNDRRPDLRLSLISAGKDCLVSVLADGSVDIAVFADAPEGVGCTYVRRTMHKAAVVSTATGLPIIPDNTDHTAVYIAHKAVGSTALCREFFRLLTDESG